MFQRPSYRWWLAGLLVLVLILAMGPPAWACPTCKDSLGQSDPQGANLVRGYFWSILFMMSMPFLILTGLGTYFYWQIRRARVLTEAGAEGVRRPVGAGANGR